MVLTFLAFLIFTYFIGSVPFGLILTRLFTQDDLRTIGSGNIGATNVLRTGNRKLAILTLLLDGSKGIAAILIWHYFVAPFQIAPCAVISCPADSPCICYPFYIPAYFPLLIALAAMIGHCYPVWLKFKGGKGVATTMGALLAAAPYAGLCAAVTWILTATILRYSSAAALLAVVVASIATFFIYGESAGGVCLMIAMLVWWRHRANIKRLMCGEESKIAFKKKNEADTVSE